MTSGTRWHTPVLPL